MNRHHTWVKVVMGVALAAVLLLAIGCGPAGSGGGSTPGTTQGAVASNDNIRRISVNGTGKAYGTPDVVYITLGVNTVNADAAKAVSDNTAAMNAVIESIKAAGVEEEDIQTVNYTMWVEQVTDKDGIPTGQSRLHIDNQVQITLRAPQKAGDLISSTLEAGANTVTDITFGILDTTALEKQAREAAIAQAKDRAQQLAAGFGAQLGAIHVVSESSALPVPVIRAANLAYNKIEAAGIAVQSGQFEVTVDIQAEFEIK